MDWSTVTLGQLCRIELGKTPARGKKEYWDEDKVTENIWLSIADIPDALKPVINDSKEYISNAGAELCKVVPAGTLIVSFKLTLGRLAITGKDLYTNEAIAALYIKDPNRLCQDYLYWYLVYFDWHAAVGSDVKVKGKTLNKAKLKEIDVILPPLHEQKRIVAILDEAFAAIDEAKAKTEQNLKNARELFDSYLQQVFSQRGEGWIEDELENLVTEDCALSYGIVQPGDDFPNGMPVVRPTDLTQEIITKKGLKLIDPDKALGYSRTHLQGGELLVCVRGSTGVTSIACNSLAGANVTRGIVPVRFDQSKIITKFGFYQFISPHIQEQIKASTYGAALMQINIRDFRKIKFSYPNIETQKSMLQKLDGVKPDLLKVEKIYNEKIQLFEELKKSLLHKAFTGELTNKELAA